MTNPIRPDQLKKVIPDEVIEAFNEVIARHWDGKDSSFRQDEVVKLICKKMGVKPKKVFDEGWLSVEGVFHEVGWNGGYDGDTPATVTFRKPR